MPHESKEDVIAFTFYSSTNSSGDGYWDGFLKEKDNILRMQKGMEEAAIAHSATPPKVEITLYLIPDWGNGETFEDARYQQKKTHMIAKAQESFGKDIAIKDLLVDVGISQEEKNFLKGLKSKGSTADLMKSRTIIHNSGRKCLQTDSNLEVTGGNYTALYNKTFAQETDAYNSSRCSEVYISAHNKVVYTSKESALPKALEDKQVGYCTEYKDDEWQHSEMCNGIYDNAFCAAMNEVGATYKVEVEDKWNPGKKFAFYPANIHDPRYVLMENIVPNQQESWRAGMEETEEVKRLKGLPPIEINNVKYGYTHFKSIVRVFTNVPTWHTNGDFKDAETLYDKFISSQSPSNKDALKTIFLHVLDELNKNMSLTMQEKEDVLKNLVKTIPNTAAGNKLTQDIFNCNVSELHNTPLQIANKLKEMALAATNIEVAPEVPINPHIVAQLSSVESDLTREKSNISNGEEKGKSMILPTSYSNKNDLLLPNPKMQHPRPKDLGETPPCRSRPPARRH